MNDLKHNALKYYPVLLALIITACGLDGRKVEREEELNQAFSDEEYLLYLPEIRTYNRANAIVHEPDTALTTQLKPTMKFVAGPVGEIGLRIFKPDTINAVVVSIHGGGWENGMAQFDDAFNDEMARTCKVAVVSVDYHLVTSENPFPTCINDCKAAATWVVNNSKSEFGTDKIIISGGSAGGHLAALTTIYIRDSLNAIDQVIGVNLMYGMFDLSRTPSNRMASDSAYLISSHVLEYIYRDGPFRGWSPEELRSPHYSPLYADLHNLPPVLFTVGTADPLVDDTFFMERRWKLAGNKTLLTVYPECPHAFNKLPIKIASVANKKIFQWIMNLSGEKVLETQ